MLVREKDYRIMSLNTFCRYGIFAAVQALWAGPYLMTTIGISPVDAGNVLLMMGIGMIVGSPVCGWFSDALFRTRKGVIIAGLGGMALVLAVLAFTAMVYCFTIETRGERKAPSRMNQSCEDKK